VVGEVIKIQEADFSIDVILQGLKQSDNGAIVIFTGIVRGQNEDYSTERLEIQVYKEMALDQLQKIYDEAFQQFDVHHINIIHRIGILKVSENIVGIAVGAGHRDEAFNACRYVLEELKKRVPLWKKEHTTDGQYWIEGQTYE
jgi:molybdopterin synthase catalytic subunit